MFCLVLLGNRGIRWHPFTLVYEVTGVYSGFVTCAKRSQRSKGGKKSIGATRLCKHAAACNVHCNSSILKFFPIKKNPKRAK